jgi:serine protease inhibitor
MRGSDFYFDLQTPSNNNNNNFDLNNAYSNTYLFKQCLINFINSLAEIKDKPKLFSPLSICYFLSLFHIGSVNKIEREITDIFKSKCNEKNLSEVINIFTNDNVKLKNFLIVNNRYKLNDQYFNKIRYLSHIYTVNFNDSTLADKINSTVSKETNNMINKIIDKDMISNNDVFILINTLYFKAEWLNNFNPDFTHNKLFDNKYMVDMMSKESNMSYYENSNIQIVECPYRNKEYSMFYILPRNNVDLKSCYSYINNSFTFSDVKVNLQVPKFKQEININLTDILRKMGIEDIFSPQTNDLSEICKGGFIQNICHKVILDNSEGGTVAIAVTSGNFTCSMGFDRPKVYDFIADHPFIYYIRHNISSIPMFIGEFHGY